MNVNFPLGFNGLGRTAECSEEKHLRDLIEQVLFTAPGERVNRPDFGSGLMQLVFAPNSDTLAAATKLSVQAALQQWLGDRIEVKAVEVANVESTLSVTVKYVSRRTGQETTAQFPSGAQP
jgi:phage baseplate assembly protein W